MANVAKEYAKALYLSLEKVDHKEEVLNILRAVSIALTEETSLFEKIYSRSIKNEEVKGILDKVVTGSSVKDLLSNFFGVLVDKGRLNYIIEITKFFESEMDLESGIIRGVVRSASPIELEKKKELEEQFSRRLNKKVILTYKKDEKVVAGLRVDVDAYTFDDTVERHIKNIKENVKRS